jgi:hypothetical protein
VQSFTNESVTDENWAGWFTGWESAFIQINELKKAPTALTISRKNYYLKAMKALSEERPAAALWILLSTWTRMAADLPKVDAPYKAWQGLLKQLTLEPRNLPARLELLDAALDEVEEAAEHLRE